MNSQTETKTEEFKTEIVRDVKRSGSEIYRIARKEVKDKRFVDVRIFFAPKEDPSRLLPTRKGILIEEASLKDVICALVLAKDSEPVHRPDGEKFRCEAVCDVPLSETEVIRISKGMGTLHGFVDIRRFFKNGEDHYVPAKNKGVSITDSAFEEVLTGLMSASEVYAS